jgi:hypothetical protein
MGFLDKLRSRTERADASEVPVAQPDPKGPQEQSGNAIYESEDSSRLSLEARNEKEVQQHPDAITQEAHLGVQKAEAAALVWSKKAVYATYAWYVSWASLDAGLIGF